jgi:hypothetical protein
VLRQTRVVYVGSIPGKVVRGGSGGVVIVIAIVAANRDAMAKSY